MENPSSSTDHPVLVLRRSPLVMLASWIRDLLVSVFLAILVILFLYQPVKVEGTSMMPALVDQERIFINKFVYRFGMGDIQRGDMVVFWFPMDPTKSYIKRVIGVPGDTVEVDNGTVIVNSQRLEESYVRMSTATVNRWLRSKFSPMSTSSWEITGVPRMTAVLGVPCRGSTSTGKPCSYTGPSRRWA